MELTRADLVVLCLLFFVLGCAFGWLLRGPSKKPPKNDTFLVAIDHVTTRVLRFVGTLDEPTAKWLANFILDGGDFSGPALERRHKRGGRLSHAQFKGVRDDLVYDRKCAEMDARGRVILHPPAYALFRHIAGRGKQATSKATEQLHLEGWTRLNVSR